MGKINSTARQMKGKLRIIMFKGTELLALGIGFFLGFSENVQAQSAEVFRPLQSKLQFSSSGKSLDPTLDIELLKSKPSRFAIENVDAYLVAKFADLSMKNRTTDPFGLNQDSDVKPVVKKVTSVAINRTQTALPSVPLSEIVKLIKVNTVLLKEKSFLVEGREFKESEEIPVVFQGRAKRLKVVDVSATAILFRDMETNEEATLKIEVLPFGMQSGDDRLKPAGMISPNENRPLDLELR
jgi:hypothetical protein